MKPLQLLGRFALVWLVGSLVGFLTPVWLLLAGLCFFLRRQHARLWMRRCLSLLLIPKENDHGHQDLP